MAATGDSGRPVLIVGGGIGGLAAALAFANKGRRVHLLEQAPQFGEVGAGIQLGPNIFRRFERLGVLDEMNKVAVFPDEMVLMDALSGDQVVRFPLGAPIRQRFGQPYAVIYRVDIHDVLLQACRRQPDLITLEIDKKVIEFGDEGTHVTARTVDGARYEGGALIGADGLWSVVRAEIVGDGKPRVAGHIAYRAVLPIDAVPEELRSNTVTLWGGPKTHLVHYPLRRGELFNLVAVFHSDKYEEGWNVYGDVEELNQRFEGQRQEVLSLLAKIEQWRMWVLCDREPVKNWSRGRITLLGDAAHPTLQYLAQGAAMAIEDAVLLADEVEKADGNFPHAFLAYQHARYLRTARIQLTSRFYGEYIYHAAGVTRDLRNQILGELAQNPSFEGMAWLYDG